MKLLLAATPARGHLNPILSLARLAIARGDEVLIATGSALAPMVEMVGAAFTPLLDEADLDTDRLEVAFPERATLPPGPEQLRFDMERIFIDPMAAQARTLKRQIVEFKPDAIITDMTFMGRIPLFYGEDQRPPIVALGLTFLPLPRPDGAPVGPGLPPATTDEERAHYAQIAQELSSSFQRPVQEYLNERVRRLGIDATLPDFMSTMVVANDIYLQPAVRSFEYDLGELPVDVRFVGALPPSLLHPERPDWWDRLDGSRPIVFVTQGTVANYDFDQLVNPALAALADRDDLHVVVATGGGPVDSVAAPDRDHIFVAPYVDYTALIPRLSLLVTNGGYGTVSHALSEGVPIVVAGQSEDKAEIATRIAWSGVGVQVPTMPPEVTSLRAAIHRTLADPSFRDSARAMAAEFREIDTPRVVMAAIDELVTGAKEANAETASGSA